MKQSPILRFESSAFAIVPGEQQATNPGITGKALAEWIREELRASGLSVGAPIAEDFGWCVPVKSATYSLYVTCVNDSPPGHWQVFAFVEGGLVDRLLRKDRSAELLAALFATLRSRLQSSSIIHGLAEEASLT